MIGPSGCYDYVYPDGSELSEKYAMRDDPCVLPKNWQVPRMIDVFKDADVGDVHTNAASGNNLPRKKFAPDLEKFHVKQLPVGKKDAPRFLKPIDDKTSHSPFPFDANALANMRPDQHPRFYGALTDNSHLEDKTVRLDSLTALQDRVDPAKVEAMQDGKAAGKLPTVVRMNGRNYIADGHHRLSSMWLDGAKEADVKYLNLTPKDNALKRDADWSVPVTVTKMDADQRLIFGWASVVTKNGQPVVDYQDDVIPVAELEKAAYDFMLYSRENDDLHVGGPTGRCVESMVFTKEKQDALGIVVKDKDGHQIEAWWTGFYVDNDALWAAHKRGQRPEFSIGGSGQRTAT